MMSTRRESQVRVAPLDGQRAACRVSHRVEVVFERVLVQFRTVRPRADRLALGVASRGVHSRPARCLQLARGWRLAAGPVSSLSPLARSLAPSRPVRRRSGTHARCSPSLRLLAPICAPVLRHEQISRVVRAGHAAPRRLRGSANRWACAVRRPRFVERTPSGRHAYASGPGGLVLGGRASVGSRASDCRLGRETGGLVCLHRVLYA
ncbi:hypothetical protein BD413DRAFT_91059 [Trametes elegans]|nr:hypothetical protein BD413DRAFT_91059 [Trametes elegans]